MLFNSIAFGVFFSVVFVLYWLLRRSSRAQNLLLLGASYFFYGWWDVRFLVLIVITTVVAYLCALSIQKGQVSPAQRVRASIFLIVSTVLFLGLNLRAVDVAIPRVVVDWNHLLVGRALHWWVILGVVLATVGLNVVYPLALRLKNERRERLFLAAGVVAYLAILGFFKYFNFFVDTFQTLAQVLFDVAPSGSLLRVLLPIGISFFTFQTLSYTVDVYRRKCAATDSLLEMATYVSFFPLLLAGPIERGQHLLPQLQKQRRFGLADWREGLWLIVWGLYKKMVVADNMARIVGVAFAPFAAAGAAPSVPPDGLRLLIVLYAFALQIYCDFSGYTDMARGTARLLGFDIMLNFNLPYLARDPSDFWRRWHISLSSWLRDYLYIPLGGNRHGTFQTYRNLMLTMLLGGLWHGAAWTFVLWGAFHGFLLVGYRALSGWKQRWVAAWRAAGARPLFGGSALVDSPAGPSFPAAAEAVAPEARGIYLRSALIVVQILVMFHLVCFGWLLFRAPNLAAVGIFLHSIFLHPHWSPEAAEALWRLVFYGWFFVLFELVLAGTQTRRPFAGWPWFIRLNIWVFVLLSLLALAARGGREFIYFAF